MMDDSVLCTCIGGPWDGQTCAVPRNRRELVVLGDAFANACFPDGRQPYPAGYAALERYARVEYGIYDRDRDISFRWYEFHHVPREPVSP